jgi:cyclopropane fatty-acyl-phospholipid synthase-like methyltransferase
MRNDPQSPLSVALTAALALGLAGGIHAQQPAHQDPHAKHGQHGHKAGGHDEGMSMHHDFSDAERWAKIFDDPARLEWQKPQEVVGLMAIRPGMTVADIGAGTGYFLGYLSSAAGAGGQVLGLDPEPKMVEHMARRIAEAGWKNATSRTIPLDGPGLEPASVDRILIVDTWHHIENRGEYSSKLAAALKPGGAVYVVDFTLESPVGPKKHHRLAPEVVAAELRAGGLTAEVVAETLPNQYIIRAAKP